MVKRVKTIKFPWSIKGVSLEARDFVRSAASERGITMGEWLTKVIQNETDAFESTGDIQQKIDDGLNITQMRTEVPKKSFAPVPSLKNPPRLVSLSYGNQCPAQSRYTDQPYPIFHVVSLHVCQQFGS